MIVPLAIDRVDVAKYAETLLIVYYVIIFARILLSWIPRMPYYRWLDVVIKFIYEVTDPYLNVFRRFMPAVRFGGGAIDLSPMVAIIAVGVASSILIAILNLL